MKNLGYRAESRQLASAEGILVAMTSLFSLISCFFKCSIQQGNIKTAKNTVFWRNSLLDHRLTAATLLDSILLGMTPHLSKDKMKTKIAIAIIFGFLLVSCTTRKYVVATNSSVPTLPYQLNADDAEIKLAEAAVSVSKSLDSLAEIEKAAHPCVRLPPPIDGCRIGLGCCASVDWVGPVEPLVRRIAEASHYCVRVIGKDPAIPVIVSVNSKNIPLSDILRNISLQIHKKACIVVYPNSHVIELRYTT
jgi:defect-in-organelle-trafficking protein DotD